MSPRRRKTRKIFVPGERVPGASGETLGRGIIKLNDGKIVSTRIGVYSSTTKGHQKIISIAPFKAPYVPTPGDTVIGKIIDVGFTNWTVDINSPYVALLPLTEVYSKPVEVGKIDLTKTLKIGDLIVAKVINFDLTRDPILTIKESRLGKVPRGIYVELTPLEYLVLKRKAFSDKNLVENLRKEFNCELFIGCNYRLIIIGKDLSSEREAMYKIISLIRNQVGD
ncbi:MAG: hypothetical protein J7L38_05540 [Thermoproteales archaeon]|nr:hypothetical protein [Thermoproteales archaeon]RLE65393.1 MAG: hypothetical protein DRJ47_05245 [Thermoprotei archaeon]